MSTKQRTLANYEAVAQSLNVAQAAVMKANIQAARVVPLQSKVYRNLSRVEKLLGEARSALEDAMYRDIPEAERTAHNYGRAAQGQDVGPRDEWMLSPFYPGQRMGRFPHLAAALAELGAIEAERQAAS